MFYPFGGTLSYSDNYLLPAFISRIVFKLCGNMAIAYNVPLIVAFLLNAISMAMLAQYLFSNRTVSFLAGLFLLLSPVMLGQVAHPQLLHFYFIPFTLLFTLRYLQHNRASDAVLSSLMVLGAFLSAVYYSFFCIMMIGGIFLYYCVANKFLSTAKKALRYFLFALPAMTILVFFAQFYLATREVFSSWPLGVVRMLSARWVSYIVAPIGNTLWAPLTYKYVKAEDTLFPGLIVLLLGVLAILCFLWKVLSRKQFILVICFLTFIVGLNFILQNIEPVNILIHSVVPWLLLLSALYLARKTSNNPQLFISGLLLFLCLLFLTNSIITCQALILFVWLVASAL
jgi:hypothetical protein